jgi:hypothetical protein
MPPPFDPTAKGVVAARMFPPDPAAASTDRLLGPPGSVRGSSRHEQHVVSSARDSLLILR